MSRVVEWIEEVAAEWGGPGLFLVAFLDSSFLSLPQINDLLVIWMVIRQPELVLYYALMPTLGSVAGCLVVYGLGRKGGDAFLRQRFRGAMVDRATALFERWGALAVFVPALLPPPAPFKLFVVLAGVMHVKPRQFAVAVLAGRGLRYFGGGLLAYYYGAEAIEFLKEHGRLVVRVFLVVTLVGIGLYLFWRRRHPRDAAERQPL